MNVTTLPQQADLLSILGVFAEPLINHERFVQIVGRERLMASDLLSYLMEEKLAEMQGKLADKLKLKPQSRWRYVNCKQWWWRQ